MKKRYSLTLLEIMIVIFLIGLIGSVIGYNMKGSLDQGRAFKTEKAAEQIHDILLMEVAKGVSIDDVVKNTEGYLAHSGLVKDPKKLLKDGWGQPFEISIVRGTDIKVFSDRYNKYKTAKKSKLGLKIEDDEDDLQENDS